MALTVDVIILKNRIILVYFKFSSVKIAEIIVRKVQRILRKF